MNKIINLLSVFCFIALFSTSCEKEPIIELSQSSLSFSDKGGIQTISLTANKSWSAIVTNGDWCIISPLKGDIGNNEIQIQTLENQSFSQREVIIKFIIGEFTKNLIIKQQKNEALFLNPNVIKVSGKGQLVNLEVKSNINYEVYIPDTIKWIKTVGSKSLITEKYVFDIGINTQSKTRKGVVLFKRKESSTIDTLYIQQDSIRNYSSKGTANSYFVPLNNLGKISISNKGNDNNQKLLINSETKFKVLWEDNKSKLGGSIIKDINIIDEHLYFQTTDNPGNVLIAILNNGEIIWSWHLCINSDAELINSFQSLSRLGFMDRNLGAINKWDPGLHYQWGRKDPLLIGKFTVDSIANNIEQSIKNPTVFYTPDGYKNYYDASSWYLDMTLNLWSTNKTIYDPCPYGYITPSINKWNVPDGIVGWNNKYFVFDNSNAFYPANSMLSHSYGQVWDNHGSYWSNSGQYSYPFRWRGAWGQNTNGNVDLYGSTFGYYVRCVRYEKEN